MLQNMVVLIRQDLRDQILARRPRRERLPDSTTGMSSVFPGAALGHIAGNNAHRNDAYQAPASTNLANTDTIKVQFNVGEESTSASSKSTDGGLDDLYTAKGGMNIEREEGAENQKGVYEDDDIRAQLMDIKSWRESSAQGRQTKSSDEDEDDDDGGVLLSGGDIFIFSS
jgi:hypothetical protein